VYSIVLYYNYVHIYIKLYYIIVYYIICLLYYIILYYIISYYIIYITIMFPINMVIFGIVTPFVDKPMCVCSMHYWLVTEPPMCVCSMHYWLVTEPRLQHEFNMM